MSGGLTVPPLPIEAFANAVKMVQAFGCTAAQAAAAFAEIGRVAKKLEDEDLHEYGHMSDDYEVMPEGSKKAEAFLVQEYTP